MAAAEGGEDVWVYYMGPQGGEGWMNMRTGEIRYQKLRPGPGPEGGDGYDDALAEGWTEPPDDLTDLMRGQRLEVRAPNGEYEEAFYGGEDEDGNPMIHWESMDEDAMPYVPANDGEITAIEDVGDEHPGYKNVYLNQDVVPDPPEWGAHLDIGDLAYIDTRDVGPIDDPARAYKVVGWNDEGVPCIEPPDELPTSDNIVLTEQHVIGEEEYNELMSGQRRLDELDLQVGDDVWIYDHQYGEYIEAEVDLIEGRLAVEDAHDAVFFPDDDEDVDIFDPEDYEYNPADFDWDPEFEPEDIVEGGGAVWIDGEGPFAVRNGFDGESIQVFEEPGSFGGEEVPAWRIDAYTETTPPFHSRYWQTENSVPPMEGEIEEGPLEGQVEIEHHPDYDEEDFETFEVPEGEYVPQNVRVLAEDEDGNRTVAFWPGASRGSTEFPDGTFTFGDLEFVGIHEDDAIWTEVQEGQRVTIDMPDAAPRDIVEGTVLGVGDLVRVETDDPDIGTFSMNPDEEFEILDIDEHVANEGDQVVYADEAHTVTEVVDGGYFLEDEDGNEIQVLTDEIGADDLIEPEPEPGDQVHYEGTLDSYEAEVVDYDAEAGAVDIRGPDGDVETVPDHAVEVIDAEAAETPAEPTGPSEDEMDGAVAGPAEDVAEEPDEAETPEGEFDPREFTPDQVESWTGLGDIEANHGNSMNAKEVAVMPDGSQMVYTDLNHHSIDIEDGERQMAGYEAMRIIDPLRTVEHAADLEEGWFANEVAPGVDAIDAQAEGFADQVSEADFLDMAATQVIIGNADAHQNNVRVDENGNLTPFDLDRAAGDVTGEWTGAFGHYDNTIDRIIGELGRTADALGLVIDPHDVLQQAELRAQEIDAEQRTEIAEAASQWNEEFASTIAENIIALRAGEVQLP